jgi:MoxR-like ATPase
VRLVYVDPALIAYATSLAAATRKPHEMGMPEFAEAIAFGASPRASIHLVEAARALAFIRGRSYALGHDITDVAPEVLRHRIVLSYDGIADEVSTETIVERVLERFPAPRIDLADRVAS